MVLGSVETTRRGLRLGKPGVRVVAGYYHTYLATIEMNKVLAHHFLQARALREVLVAGINSDAWVRLKGEQCPILCEAVLSESS